MSVKVRPISIEELRERAGVAAPADDALASFDHAPSSESFQSIDSAIHSALLKHIEEAASGRRVSSG